MKKRLLLQFFIIPVLLFGFQQAYSTRYYVATDGDGSDGLTWATAFTTIQTAIDESISGDEIWVKEGVYYASASDRSISITLKSGVKLYGSFTADEASINDRPMSDVDGNGSIEPWEYTSPTTITGEIQNDGDISNNTQHIVVIPAGVDAQTLVDGFVIEKGYSDTPTSGTVFASGVNVLGGKISGLVVKDCESVATSLSFGGGIYASNSQIEGVLIKDCSINSNDCFGGGMYVEGSVVKNTTIESCSVTLIDDIKKSNGGGMFAQNTHLISCSVFNCKAEGSTSSGGGIYMISSTAINTLAFNNEAGYRGGGLYNFGSIYTNGLLANNKIIGSSGSGGGAYGDLDSYFYNTVFWSNVSAFISPQLKIETGATIMNCAVDGETAGTNGINISSSNTGATGGVLYPEFKSPTSFDGLSGGNSTYDAQLLAANWDISFTSSLMEKGYNNAFDEALLSTSGNVDLNGDGDNFDKIDNFTDYISQYRKFNKAVDIGPYEPAFVTLTLPAGPTLEYGKTLGEITLTGGSALDLRTNTAVTGGFSFVDAATVPQFNDGVPEKFRVVFTPTDLSTYAVIYDSVAVTITAKELTLSGLTADDKVYDGNTSVTFSGTAILGGVVGSDDVSLSTGAITAAFEDKNAGVDKNVIFDGYTLSGVDAGNYYLSLAGAQATITPKPVSVSAVTANNKAYDGTTIATFSGAASVNGKIGGDDVTVDITSAKGDFNDKKVGVGKTVTFSGFALTGADAGNYTLSQPPNSTANITPLNITVSGLSAENKEYNGNTKATIVGAPAISGAINGDDVNLNITTAAANFSDKNVGANKVVSFSGYILTGADGPNYTLSQPADVTADITAKELTITGLTAQDKDYDGSTAISFSGTASLQGVVIGDDVTLDTSGASAAFVDANAGVDKVVNISGYAMVGVDISNYTLVQPTATATILPIAIAIKADDKSKVYNETDPALTYTITSGSLVSGDVFSGSLARVMGEDAGVYSINQGSLNLSSNYYLSFTAGQFTITKATNTISFILSSPVVFGEVTQITLSASSDSPNAVAFSSSEPAIASVSGTTLSIHSYGTVVITASDAGTINYVAATSVTQDLTIQLDVKAIEKGTQMLLIDNTDEQFSSYQWYKNSVAISGETKQYFYANDGLLGTYYCMVTTIKGDEFKSNEITRGAMAVMQIYPSPVLKGATFNVDFNGAEQQDISGTVMKVYAVTGKLILQVDELMDINQLQIEEPGVYIIKTEGALQETRKIIVK